ncbi:MAG: sigma 54-interacting transcriptional regulator [Ectothiorhodospiraceae bacterium]|nr:sigma 54-interacting transcriptional regulator [Ectothiorhodospiraceae bacterium]
MERRSILLVDDDPGLLRLLSIRLKSAGYKVNTAESGEQALALLAAFRPELIITDLRMDGMDGLALFEAVHREHPTLPVIILTAHGSIPEAVEATRNGVFSFLTKPFDSQKLLEQVAAAMEISGGMSETGNPITAGWADSIVTRSAIMKDVLSKARMVADSDASVFVSGDSGTGKELLARAIHDASRRKDMPFVAVNCGAIPEPLLESELFGHRKGSFTGATQDHSGLFQAADGGTLFLDEIGDMPLPLQVKLLRVLQEQQVRPVGATRSIAVNVRIISATHRNLEEEMEEGRFREDLYYRLNVVSLELPALADRREDIPLLANHFLKHLADKYHKTVRGFAPDAMERLVSAPWPGNIRQLYNVVEQVVTLTTTPMINDTLIQNALRDEPGTILPFADARRRFEKDYLARLLQTTGGNVSQAARLAKRNRTEFYKLLHRHAIDPGLFKSMERGQ